MISSFAGKHRFLSNFFVEPDGTSVEHEFAAAKTWDLHDKALILGAATPGKAKRLGRKVALRPDWDGVRIGVMRDLVFRKFWDHPELAEKLLATGDEELIEGNHWHDNFWGDCECEECAFDGRNVLGIILMEIRTTIRDFKEGV